MIEEYNLTVLDNIKKYINLYDEKPKYLNKSKVIDFIDNISNIDIQERIEVIKENGMEGLK